MDDQRLKEITGQLIDIVAAAGSVILEVYETNFDVQTKSDDSPLTVADLSAHKVIDAGLQELTPDIPIISEESVPPSYAVRSQWTRYWLVDPLDGTKEFVNRNGEFTVNIALIEGDTPIFGIVGVPFQGKIYVGNARKGEAYLLHEGVRTDLKPHLREAAEESLTIVASRNHGGDRLEAYLGELDNLFADCTRTPVGSSLKLCVLAENKADIYPRLGLTSEWDIGAAQAVLYAAGGGVFTEDGQPLRYNTKESLLNPEFLAVADREFPWLDRLPNFPAKD
ncbi:MAG: 3'(2'), 5'-bisphosphate nucleotidase [Candidatus Azotimanducaceae bacterium]|jgi:3'(2'), 5'-bisphosphate nucleotidase|tara:strand:- start:561 stop:1400 length:840 start_codon:yes stop_codon:yes gene_type:complete